MQRVKGWQRDEASPQGRSFWVVWVQQAFPVHGKLVRWTNGWLRYIACIWIMMEIQNLQMNDECTWMYCKGMWFCHSPCRVEFLFHQVKDLFCFRAFDCYTWNQGRRSRWRAPCSQSGTLQQLRFFPTHKDIHRLSRHKKIWQTWQWQSISGFDVLPSWCLFRHHHTALQDLHLWNLLRSGAAYCSVSAACQVHPGSPWSNSFEGWPAASCIMQMYGLFEEPYVHLDMWTLSRLVELRFWFLKLYSTISVTDIKKISTNTNNTTNNTTTATNNSEQVLGIPVQVRVHAFGSPDRGPEVPSPSQQVGSWWIAKKSASQTGLS